MTNRVPSDWFRSVTSRPACSVRNGLPSANEPPTTPIRRRLPTSEANRKRGVFLGNVPPIPINDRLPLILRTAATTPFGAVVVVKVTGATGGFFAVAVLAVVVVAAVVVAAVVVAACVVVDFVVVPEALVDVLGEGIWERNGSPAENNPKPSIWPELE